MNEQQAPNPLASLPDDEVDVWNFTDEQVEIIRRRLWVFKQHAGANKKAIPLKSLHYQILTSEVTANGFDLDGSPNFKEEALRRFMRGITGRMDDDKLADAYRFLVEKKYLSNAEMREEPLNIKQALLFHSHLSSSSDTAKALLNLLPGDYWSSREGRGVYDEMGMRLTKCKSDDFFEVKEECVRYSFEQAEEDKSNGRKVPRQSDRKKEFHKKRAGFAYICTENNLLYIFLFGANRADLTIYAQFGQINFERDQHVITLSRSWTEFPSKASSFNKEPIHLLLEDYRKHILDFYLVRT